MHGHLKNALTLLGPQGVGASKVYDIIYISYAPKVRGIFRDFTSFFKANLLRKLLSGVKKSSLTVGGFGRAGYLQGLSTFKALVSRSTFYSQHNYSGPTN